MRSVSSRATSILIASNRVTCVPTHYLKPPHLCVLTRNGLIYQDTERSTVTIKAKEQVSVSCIKCTHNSPALHVMMLTQYTALSYLSLHTAFSTAQAVCAANGFEQSYPYYVVHWRAGPCQDGIRTEEFRSWAFHDCGLKVKIDVQSAQIAIVHSP